MKKELQQWSITIFDKNGSSEKYPVTHSWNQTKEWLTGVLLEDAKHPRIEAIVIRREHTLTELIKVLENDG
jgi:hypothetical protein